MPLFRYSITRGSETKTADLRKSNPQGWLLDAVKATFPDVASRRGVDLVRLSLVAVQGAKQSWRATLHDGEVDLLIQVAQARA